MTRSDSNSQPMSAEPAGRPTLRCELRFAETAAVSIGVMAPTLAMSVTGVAAASALGRAAPLAFVFAALGVGFVAYGFVRLAGEFSHSGSVYAFVGNTLGPRPGFLAGWALLGTYLVFPAVSIMGVAIFGRAFLDTTGLVRDADWYPLALAAWVVIWVLAARGVRPTTRSLRLPPDRLDRPGRRPHRQPDSKTGKQTTDQHDVIIIGTGAGGGTLA
jgi:amino acid transporter